jgi:hypothetical protein
VENATHLNDDTAVILGCILIYTLLKWRGNVLEPTKHGILITWHGSFSTGFAAFQDSSNMLLRYTNLTLIYMHCEKRKEN